LVVATTVDATEPRGAILVLDDDDRLLAAYRRAFESSFAVQTASTVAEAVSLSQQHSFRYAVLDLYLDEGSSIAFIRQLRTEQPNVHIVVVSGYLNTDAVVTAVKAGAHCVLDKPVMPREILRRLQVQPANDVDRYQTPTLDKAIDAHIARVLTDCGGNVSEAARRLGLYRSSLQRRLSKRRMKLLE
jgi:two-component system response regulator RegA